MTIEQYLFCVSETKNYTDADAYVSDLALSSIWDDAEDAEVPANRLDDLRAIYTASRRGIKQIAADAGLPLNKLADRFAIPRRTVENWSAGVRSPSLWELLLLQEALGILNITR